MKGGTLSAFLGWWIPLASFPVIMIPSTYASRIVMPFEDLWRNMAGSFSLWWNQSWIRVSFTNQSRGACFDPSSDYLNRQISVETKWLSPWGRHLKTSSLRYSLAFCMDFQRLSLSSSSWSSFIYETWVLVVQIQIMHQALVDATFS